MANKILTVRDTPITFKQSGGTIAFNPSSLANGAARISDQWNRGTIAVTDRYIWRVRTRAAVAPVVGALLKLYLATSDGTNNDGELGINGGLVPTLDRLRNCQPFGVVEVDEASNTRLFIRSGVVEILEQYVQVIWLNEFGQALHATTTDHVFSLTPVSLEVQA